MSLHFNPNPLSQYAHVSPSPQQQHLSPPSRSSQHSPLRSSANSSSSPRGHYVNNSNFGNYNNSGSPKQQLIFPFKVKENAKDPYSYSFYEMQPTTMTSPTSSSLLHSPSRNTINAPPPPPGNLNNTNNTTTSTTSPLVALSLSLHTSPPPPNTSNTINNTSSVLSNSSAVAVGPAPTSPAEDRPSSSSSLSHPHPLHTHLSPAAIAAAEQRHEQSAISDVMASAATPALLEQNSIQTETEEGITLLFHPQSPLCTHQPNKDGDRSCTGAAAGTARSRRGSVTEMYDGVRTRQRIEEERAERAAAGPANPLNVFQDDYDSNMEFTTHHQNSYRTMAWTQALSAERDERNRNCSPLRQVGYGDTTPANNEEPDDLLLMPLNASAVLKRHGDTTFMPLD